MLAWIVSPITQYAILALGLLCGLAMFVSLKLEISVLRRMLQEVRETPTSVPPELPAPPPPPPPPVTVPQLPGPDLNLTARAQALRMELRGESVSTIAAALRAPQNEIELLLKLQSLLSPDRRN